MKKFMGLILAGAAALALATGALAADAKPAKVGKFKLKTAEGTEITQEAFKGKTTILIFAQSACSQCRGELKAVSDAYDDLSAKAQIFTVLVDVNPERGLEFYKSQNFKPTVILDDGFVLGTAGSIGATPATMIVDKELNVTFTKTGWRGGDIEALKEKL